MSEELSARILSMLSEMLPGGKALRPKAAIDRLEKKAGGSLTRMQIREGLAELKRSGALTGVSETGLPVGLISLTEPAPARTDVFLRKWEQLIERAGDLPPPKAVRSLDERTLRRLTGCINRFNPASFLGVDRYILSAKSFLGSAKVLDSLPGLLSDHERERPLFAVTAGPQNPANVLLVENQSAFLSIMQTAFINQNMIICCFGYGLTIEHLPRRLEEGTLIPCPAAGDRPENLSEIISSRPIFHWGDLDQEGLRIYTSLKKALPQLALSRIYRDMSVAVANSTLSHPYHSFFGKAGQRAVVTDDPLIGLLSELCKDRAVDQEAACPVENLQDLTTPLTLADLELECK